MSRRQAAGRPVAVSHACMNNKDSLFCVVVVYSILQDWFCCFVVSMSTIYVMYDNDNTYIFNKQIMSCLKAKHQIFLKLSVFCSEVIC